MLNGGQKKARYRRNSRWKEQDIVKKGHMVCSRFVDFFTPVLAFSLRVWGLVSREYDVLVCRRTGSRWIRSRRTSSRPDTQTDRHTRTHRQTHTQHTQFTSKIIISFHRSLAYQGISPSQPKHLQRYINADSISAWRIRSMSLHSFSHEGSSAKRSYNTHRVYTTAKGVVWLLTIIFVVHDRFFSCFFVKWKVENGCPLWASVYILPVEVDDNTLSLLRTCSLNIYGINATLVPRPGHVPHPYYPVGQKNRIGPRASWRL